MLMPSPRLMEKPSVSDTIPMPAVHIAAEINTLAGGRRDGHPEQLSFASERCKAPSTSYAGAVQPIA